MPTQVVDVDLRSETGAIAQRTYSDLVVVAREPDVADPDYNEPRAYDTSSAVASDFGSDSDAYAASQEIEGRGASQWWVVMLESTEQEETFHDGSTGEDQAQLDNLPLRGGVENISVSVDGDDMVVEPVTESPPDAPESGVAAVNFDTGEVYTGDSTGGDQGIEVTYEILSWDEAITEMQPRGFDLVVLADTRADRSYIGELDQVVSFCETEKASTVVAYEDGREYTSDVEAMEAAQDIGSYITSGHVLPIAHKSDDDVAAGVAGRLATKRPWHNPYMDGSADYSFSMGQYRESLIGRPTQTGTFEGGGDDGEGPANVLHTEMGVQILSNSITTAGESSNYQFFDVARTEDFIVNETRLALRSLRLSNDAIPFAPVGKTLIENALRKTLNPYVAASGRALSQEEIQRLRQSAQFEDSEETPEVFPERRSSNAEANVPLSELDIYVPDYNDLSQRDRANRRWTGIQITARLAGNAHTFSVELAVQV